MPLDSSIRYHLRHIEDGLDEPLKKFLTRRVVQCYVEFLRPGSIKPHVVFKLNVHRTVSTEKATYKSCRLSMDCERVDEIGYFFIKLLPYLESSHSAAISFQFPVADQYTVGDWIDVLRGRHALCSGQHQGDMTAYSFEVADTTNGPDGQLAGCRDFISQAMIRLTSLGFVSWYFSGEAVTNIRLINYNLFVTGNGFHNAIGNNFRKRTEIPHEEIVALDQLAASYGHPVPPTSSEITKIYVTELKMSRGKFWDLACSRFEEIADHALPYKPMSPREQAALARQQQLLHNPQWAVQRQQWERQFQWVRLISMGYSDDEADAILGEIPGGPGY